jgi:hypothetical protein
MPFFAVAAPYVPMHSGAAEVRRRKRISLRQTIIFSAKRLRFATPFCNRFRLKMIVLPRQAPDKPREESTQKERCTVFLAQRLRQRSAVGCVEVLRGHVSDGRARRLPLLHLLGVSNLHRRGPLRSQERRGAASELLARGGHLVAPKFEPRVLFLEPPRLQLPQRDDQLRRRHGVLLPTWRQQRRRQRRRGCLHQVRDGPA